MFKTVLLITMLFCVSPLGAGWDSFNEYTIKDMLREPGVKLLAVDFYATWCEPCNKAIPQWKKLQEKYGSNGFKLIVISVQSAGSCTQPPDWAPDRIICDYDGEIASRWKSRDLPQAFLWSWQGNLLVAHGHVRDVEKAVERYFQNIPRVLVEEPKDKMLYQLVRSELRKNSKIEIVATDKERSDLRTLKKKSHIESFDEKLQCKIGEEISANSRLTISRQKRGAKDFLVLDLFSVERGCLVASGVAPYQGDLGTVAARAVYDLLKGLFGNMMMPGTPMSPPPPPQPQVNDQETMRSDSREEEKLSSLSKPPLSSSEKKELMRRGHKYYQRAEYEQAIKAFRGSDEVGLAEATEDILKQIEKAKSAIGFEHWALALDSLDRAREKDEQVRAAGYKAIAYTKETSERWKYKEFDDESAFNRLFSEFQREIGDHKKWKDDQLRKINLIKAKKEYVDRKKKIERDFLARLEKTAKRVKERLSPSSEKEYDIERSRDVEATFVTKEIANIYSIVYVKRAIEKIKEIDFKEAKKLLYKGLYYDPGNARVKNGFVEIDKVVSAMFADAERLIFDAPDQAKDLLYKLTKGLSSTHEYYIRAKILLFATEEASDAVALKLKSLLIFPTSWEKSSDKEFAQSLDENLGFLYSVLKGANVSGINTRSSSVQKKVGDCDGKIDCIERIAKDQTDFDIVLVLQILSMNGKRFRVALTMFNTYGRKVAETDIKINAGDGPEDAAEDAAADVASYIKAFISKNSD